MRKDRGNDLKGIVLVDKPAGLTSHDVVDHLRRASGMRRIGHTGTLDPGATGLMILCLGPATRLSEFLTGLDKTYEGMMRLGVETDSYDLDGTVLGERPVPALDQSHIQAACTPFVGDIMQTPPMVSAVKVEGKRLYERARKGEVVERPSRPVTVHEFTINAYSPPDATFILRCTSGTYARALCHDVGQALGCGGVLAALRRTAVGRHHIESAVPLDSLQTREDVEKRLMPMGEALDLPEVILANGARRKFVNGGSVDRNDITQDCPVREGWVQVKSTGGELLAIADVQPGQRILPKRLVCADAR